MAAATGLAATGGRALGRLADAGLVVDGGARLVVDGAAFQRAARAALARPPSDEHADETGERRRVMEAFVRDGRLTSIPAARASGW